jgi:predicted Zn-dependent peptidase
MLATAGRSAGSSRTAARALVREGLYGGTLRARSVFPTPATLRAMSADSLRAMAKRYFVGQRLLLVVATSLDPDTIHALAADHLGALPRGVRPTPLPSRSSDALKHQLTSQTTHAIPDTLATLPLPPSTLLRTAHLNARQARLAWVRPLGVVSEADFPAIKLWNAALSNAIQFQLREREGLAYSIGSSVDRMEDGTVLWTASAGTRLANLARVLEGFQEELAKALDTPPDSATVERQGYQMYGRSLMRRATRMNRAYAAGMAVLEGRDPAGIDEEIRAPTRVTLDQISGLLPSLREVGPGLVAIAY